MNPVHLPDLPPRGEVLRQERGEVVSVDLGPPGFTSKHWIFLITTLICGSMFIGLGGVGVTLALTASDFGALRLLIGPVGAVAIVVPLGFLTWVLWHASGYRERIQSGPGWLVIRRRTRRVRDRWMMLECPVRVATGHTDTSRVHHVDAQIGVVLEGRDGRRVGLGVDQTSEVRARLRTELERVVALANSTRACLPEEWIYPMNPRLRRRLLAFAQLFTASLRRPLPFLLTDLLCFAGIFGLSRLILIPGLLGSYVVASTLFVVGLFVRRWDRSYMTTLAGFQGTNLSVGYVGAGVVMGLAAALTFWTFFKTPVVLVMGGIVLAVHVHLLRRAGREPAKGAGQTRFVELLSSLLMLPLALAHEHMAFLYCADLTEEFYVLALPLIVPMVGLFYLPVRMHAFIDDPDNRSNYAWFWLTVLSMALVGTAGWSPL